MQKSLLGSVIQTAGFATVGFLFLIWFLGREQNSGALVIAPEDPAMSRAEITGMSDTKLDRDYETSSYADARSYAGGALKAPRPVTRRAKASLSHATSKRERDIRRSRSSERAVVREAAEVRSWKGVHRDESFAWRSFERFGREVVALSEEHGLYPDVFLARIIAYSYEYTSDPRVDPADNNFTALPHPRNEGRARFRSPEESLKAYAVFHAGEVNRLSREGAIGKNDRAWTMRKIIDNYAFVANLAQETGERDAYRGRVGAANKVSEEENYQREMVGEAIRMTASVDDIVKKRRAESAGYSNWEDYLDDLSEEERAEEREKAAAKTSAVSKKKAFNLSRRVRAKKGGRD